jgi:hypothetical protein
LGCLDEFFDRKLHCLYNEVATVRNANHIVVGEKVGCKFVSKGVGDVAHDEAADGSGDSKGAKWLAFLTANCISVGKKVGCNFVSKGVGNVARNEAADGGGDSKGTKEAFTFLLSSLFFVISPLTQKLTHKPSPITTITPLSPGIV